MSSSLILLIAAAVFLFWAISIYNRFVKNKNMVEEAWSGIDVQLKRRANLIPNLLESVKGYMGHEKDVLTNVTEMRSKSMGAEGVAEQGRAEGLLSGALGRLFAVAENYPDLKASRNFIELQGSLQEAEDLIEKARRYYNGTVRELNILVESFPSNMVARIFNFREAEFFELEDPSDREVPKVSF